MRRWLLPAVAAFAAAGLVPVWPALAVSPQGGPTSYLPAAAEQEFSVTFTHSVDRLPVADLYAVRDGTVVLRGTRLVEFGAGMGQIPERGTGRRDGDTWLVTGIDEAIGELHLRTAAPRRGHVLRHGGQQVGLSECWPRQRVTLSAARVSTVRRIALAAGVSQPPCRRPEDGAFPGADPGAERDRGSRG